MARNSDTSTTVPPTNGEKIEHPWWEPLEWFLKQDKTEDGKERLTSEIKIEAGAGNILVSLVDHHEGRRLVVASTTLPEALERLSRGLADPLAVWMVYRSRKPKPKK